MLAISQYVGRLPVVYDSVNITFNTGEISSAQFLRIKGGIRSGPYALFT